MYLDLGQDVILQEDIIGIFDLDTATVAARTRDFLREAETTGSVRMLGSDLPRSFVLAQREEDGPQSIYLSGFSGATLAKRAQEIY